MKKLTILMIVILIPFAIIGVSKVLGFEIEKIIPLNETPEQATINIMKAIKNVDIKKLKKYGVANLLGTTSPLNNKRNAKIFKTLDFKIISSEETENTAKVKIEIKTKDMTSVPQIYADRSVVLAREDENIKFNIFNTTSTRKKFSDLFIDVVDKCEYQEFNKTLILRLNKSLRRIPR